MDATKTPDIDNKHRDDNDGDSSDSNKKLFSKTYTIDQSTNAP